jgi:hypothetical protein
MHESNFSEELCDGTQEDFMQIRNARSTRKPTTRDEHDDLLDCRMAMLGLDLYAIALADSEAFDKIKRRCTNCDFREACTLDLKRDPNNPVWETYCPNSGALIALTQAWWPAH